jgi:hypothetical protein
MVAREKPGPPMTLVLANLGEDGQRKLRQLARFLKTVRPIAQRWAAQSGGRLCNRLILH